MNKLEALDAAFIENSHVLVTGLNYGEAVVTSGPDRLDDRLALDDAPRAVLQPPEVDTLVLVIFSEVSASTDVPSLTCVSSGSSPNGPPT